jgi:hypothetical protein
MFFSRSTMAAAGLAAPRRLAEVHDLVTCEKKLAA